ncbi:hypothetical protein Moror_5706 [Moniliophthora roreri MCA 2997]|uniref:Uncharacterized protein n=1 Tax=Moniliophthora roreri (strain MCA 2997) TaxID=1381753 RepID=V2WMB6_MONRO|nr:hypothetical protein Moror_5706 [Moniliophthora roreri MCA 2997]
MIPLSISTNTPFQPIFLTIVPSTKEQLKQIVVKKDVITFTWSQCDNIQSFSADSCPLKIDGKGIPMKLWPWVFGHEVHNGSDERWKAYKGR